MGFYRCFSGVILFFSKGAWLSNFYEQKPLCVYQFTAMCVVACFCVTGSSVCVCLLLLVLLSFFFGKVSWFDFFYEQEDVVLWGFHPFPSNFCFSVSSPHPIFFFDIKLLECGHPLPVFAVNTQLHAIIFISFFKLFIFLLVVRETKNLFLLRIFFCDLWNCYFFFDYKISFGVTIY